MYRLLSRNLDAWGSENQILVQKVLQKKLSLKSFFMDVGVDFCSLLEALGVVSVIFAALETGLKIVGFSRV